MPIVDREKGKNMIKVVGYERKTGEYNNIRYDNLCLYTISDDLPSVTGYFPNTVKIKYNQLCDIFHCNGVELTNVLNNIINKEIAIDMAYVGRYPQLVGIRILSNVVNEKSK